MFEPLDEHCVEMFGEDDSGDCPSFVEALELSGWLSSDIEGSAYRARDDQGALYDVLLTLPEPVPDWTVDGASPYYRDYWVFEAETAEMIGMWHRLISPSTRYETWCCAGRHVSTMIWGDYVHIDDAYGEITTHWDPEDFNGGRYAPHDPGGKGCATIPGSVGHTVLLVLGLIVRRSLGHRGDSNARRDRREWTPARPAPGAMGTAKTSRTAAMRRTTGTRRAARPSRPRRR